MSQRSSTNTELLEPRLHEAFALDNIAIKPVESSIHRSPIHLVGPEGQIHIHTAPYRGSFSLVLSTAIRAAGLGSRVMVAQFLKGGVDQGPNASVNICGKLNWVRPAFPGCISENISTHDAESRELAHIAVSDVWELCRDRLLQGDLDQLVLDEIGLSISLGYIKKEEVISTLEQRPRTMDIILTGPAIPSEIMGIADQITELRCGL